VTGVRIVPFGDAAILVELNRRGVVSDARRARLLAGAIDALRTADPRLGVPVPAAASVLVPFEPRTTDAGEIGALLQPVLETLAATAVAPADPDPDTGAEHVVLVRYGGVDGPDLDAVAAETGLGAAGVIDLHAGRGYEVLFAGFAPGFAYLGELPVPLQVPRLATPRTRVPPGSVAIAGTMTAIYPGASPGGWRLIGRTDMALFNPGATPPARLRAGDRVRFVPA
jgi:KipI family sensor histidine kinase inhibitor